MFDFLNKLLGMFNELLSIFLPLFIPVLYVVIAISVVLRSRKRRQNDEHYYNELITQEEDIDALDEKYMMMAKLQSATAETHIAKPQKINTVYTEKCLRQIQKDFPEYNYVETIRLLKGLIFEYLQIKYKHINKFTRVSVDKEIYSGIIRSNHKHNLSEFKFHQAAVVGYSRTHQRAIITYQVAFGYKEGFEQKEVVFTINYTLRMDDINGTLFTVECPECGAELPIKYEQTCEYCGRTVIRNTNGLWKFSTISEETENTFTYRNDIISQNNI